MSSIVILYGKNDMYIDVTKIVLSVFVSNDVLTIPKTDHARSQFLGDPIYGVEKEIIIILNDVEITVGIHQEYTLNLKDYNLNDYINNLNLSETSAINFNVKNKLHELQSKLSIDYGTFNEEYNEQIMAVTYINPDDKVLELGSNIGRNSLIIASLLNDHRNLITMECNPIIYDKVVHNRNKNNQHFIIENAAISYQDLYCLSDRSYTVDNAPKNAIPVNTITFEELEEKYSIKFNVLVADCEGALYYLLKDAPYIIDNMDKLILENDYDDIRHKIFIDDIFKDKGFKCIYTCSGGRGPCYANFFEVWSK